MNTSSNTDKLAGRSSDALAIFEKDIILYATNSFEKLYNHLNHTARERFNTKLRDLHLNLRKTEKTFIQKQITLTPSDKAIYIYVYLLNKYESKKNCLLAATHQSS